MRIDGQGAVAASTSAAGQDRLVDDLIARSTGPGGIDVITLRDAVDRLKQEQPELGEQVHRDIAARLSITDRGVFEGAAPQRPAADGQTPKTLVVDDHRPASTLSELNRWEANYRQLVEANGGPFANSPGIEANFAHNRAQLEAATRIADAEVNKLLFVGLGAPALAGAGAALAPAAGALAGEQVVGAIGSTIARYATSASVGSATNVALEAGKNASFGTDGTAGSYVGAAAGGALGGTGIKLLGQAAPSHANNIALGAMTGFGGEVIAQAMDVSSGEARAFNGQNIGAAAVIGAGASAVTPLELRVNGLNAGRNNSVAIQNGLQARLDSGNISGHQLRYSVEAGVGTAVTGTAQGALGAAATGVYQKAMQ